MKELTIWIKHSTVPSHLVNKFLCSRYLAVPHNRAIREAHLGSRTQRVFPMQIPGAQLKDLCSIAWNACCQAPGAVGTVTDSLPAHLCQHTGFPDSRDRLVFCSNKDLEKRRGGGLVLRFYMTGSVMCSPGIDCWPQQLSSQEVVILPTASRSIQESNSWVWGSLDE